jgi:hypothetical protein
MILANHRQPEESVSPSSAPIRESFVREIVPKHNGVIPVPVGGRIQQEKIGLRGRRPGVDARPAGSHPAPRRGVVNAAELTYLPVTHVTFHTFSLTLDTIDGWQRQHVAGAAATFT